MQGNGRRNPDLDGGFERGGWARPLFDNEAMTFVNEVYRRADAFLFVAPFGLGPTGFRPRGPSSKRQGFKQGWPSQAEGDQHG
jgi:hypothetical protein